MIISLALAICIIGCYRLYLNHRYSVAYAGHYAIMDSIAAKVDSIGLLTDSLPQETSLRPTQKHHAHSADTLPMKSRHTSRPTRKPRQASTLPPPSRDPHSERVN